MENGVGPLWKTIWRFLKQTNKKNTKNRTTAWSCNSIPGHISRENSNLKRYMHPNVHSTLFTIAKMWKQPKCSLTKEWTKKMWCVCIYIWMMEYWAMLCWVAQSCPTLFKSMDCTPSGSSVHGNSLGQNTGVGCHALLQGNLPNPGIEPRSPALQADSLPSEPPGKPKHTGVGSLSLLQGIFSTQESKRGLLHWGWILYQMSYLGSPNGTLLSH